MRFSISLFFVLLLSTFVFAQDFSDMARLSLPAVILSMIALLALMYMASTAFQLPQLQGWVKTEIRELIVAAILFVIVIGFFNGGAGALVELLTGTRDFQAVATTFTGDMIGRAYDANTHVTRLFHAVGMRAGFSASLAVPLFYSALSSSTAPYSGYGSFFIFLSQASNDLTNMIFLYGALNVLLSFFTSNQFSSLIYLAFAFRFIPFTRSLGSTLIAIVIGAYIIYPASIVLVNNFHGSIDVPRPVVSPAVFTGDGRTPGLEFQIPRGAGVICRSGAARFLIGNFGELGFALPPCLIVLVISWFTGGSLFAACMQLLMGIVYPIVSMGIAIAWGLQIAPLFFESAPSVMGTFDFLYPFSVQINHLVVVSYIDLIIVSLITVVGTKSIAGALGGEYLIPGVQKLVG